MGTAPSDLPLIGRRLDIAVHARHGFQYLCLRRPSLSRRSIVLSPSPSTSTSTSTSGHPHCRTRLLTRYREQQYLTMASALRDALLCPGYSSRPGWEAERGLDGPKHVGWDP